MNSVALYDFEGNVPTIIAAAFPPEMNVGTTNQAPDLQKPRPRIDMQFRAITAAAGPRVMGVFGLRAIGAYEGDLELDLITEPSLGGKEAHSAYRAAVRSTLELDKLRNAVNLNTSPYQVDFIYCTGASDTIKTDKGYETSHMSYKIQFSIKQDAFNQLAA